MMFTGSDGSATRGPATINCTLSDSVGSASAICAGQTSLSGLGVVTSTSTVANTYVAVSITAGGDNLLSVAMQTARTGSGASSTSSGSGSVVTGGWWAAGGAAGLVALGAL
ncbi:hypothetical protein LTR86_003242 [Recurvomyces mirabilis]|nr:hypothetical protein LTR86_003242 [Recurvomyces mirabilis]